MPRRYAPKRRAIRRKRYARRPNRRIRRRPTTYAFKRQMFYENLMIVPPSGLGYTFSQPFSTISGSSDFTNLYDQYCIKKIVVKMIPKINSNVVSTGGVTAGNADLCQVHSAIDYDDALAPTSVAPLVEYESYKMTRGSQIHTRVFTPRVELNVGSSDSAPKSYQWLDCDNTGIQHRGIKFWFSGPQSSVGTNLYFDMLVKVYFSCKNVL